MQRLIRGQVFTRRDIAALFGGNARAFLPRASGGDVVAGCFDPAMNPRVPAEVLVHNAPNAMLAAKRLVQQSKRTAERPDPAGGPVPVFIKLEPNVWEYVGRFRAVGFVTDAAEVARRIYEIRPRVYEKYVREYGEMKGILLLEEE
jgi:hypothetical protein